MHVAVDARNLLTDPRGIGTYVRALLRQFARRDDLELTLLLDGWLPSRHRRAVEATLESMHFSLARSVPRSADVLWSPWNGTFVKTNLPSVATIHDCVPFALPNLNVKAREREQAPFYRSAKTAARICTDSHFSAREIEHYLDVPTDRIRVIPLAVDEIYTPGDAESLPSGVQANRYILVVGANDARKNRATLVAAWQRARANVDIALVTVGGEPAEGAIHARDLTTKQLRDLYRGARALAMPSTYEGFGLPALESLACGTPVLASRVASLSEACGDAALYVDDPLDVAAWAQAIERIATDNDLRDRLARRGLTHAAQYSWKKTAEATLAVFREVATPRPSP